VTPEEKNIPLVLENLKIGYPATGREPGFSRGTISFSAHSGETVALIGPNGTGKSTLLRTVCGYLPALSGTCLLRGKQIQKYTPRELSRMISFVSTETFRVANMSVAALVAYGRFPYTNWTGKLNDADQRIVAEAMDKAGISHLAQRMVTQVSDGERQRAFIARAVAQDTPVMILDEPTAFLDINNKYEIFHLLHEIARREGKTVILSTHDMNIALREMDKLWIMTETENLEGAPEDAMLKGWIGSMFSGGNIFFNAEEGEFHFRKRSSGSVRVKGEGTAFRLTVRALKRRGYSVNREEPSDREILVVQTEGTGAFQWELRTKEVVRIFNSIYSLLTEL
jgi:iron complex transport system ATP-binding protein